jgi:hypothetical protein
VTAKYKLRKYRRKLEAFEDDEDLDLSDLEAGLLKKKRKNKKDKKKKK